jgi:hypothetical protein
MHGKTRQRPFFLIHPIGLFSHFFRLFFLLLLIFCCSPKALLFAEPITGAFGFGLGDVHARNPKSLIETYGMNAAIPVKPRIANTLFDSYAVRITPINGRIYSIEANGPMDFFECRRKSTALLGKLEAKYGAGEKNDAGDPLQLVFNSMRITKGKREILLYCNPIAFFDGESKPSRMSIKYIDTELLRQAEREQKELEAREADDSGL